MIHYQLFPDDSYIEGHKRIIDAVHEADGKIFLQAAKAASCKEVNGTLRGMSIDEWTMEEIREVVSAFSDAALRDAV